MEELLGLSACVFALERAVDTRGRLGEYFCLFELGCNCSCSCQSS